MTGWHETWSARIGLRLAGVALLVSAWAEGPVLRHLVHSRAGQDVSVTEFLLACLIFTSSSAGTALALLGAGLWQPVAVSARWAAAPAPARRP